MQQLKWPTDLIDPDEVRAWITGILPGKPSVEGPVAIEWAKQWGVTARFTVHRNGNREETIFKASHLPLFTHGPRLEEVLQRHIPAHTPAVLAWQSWPDRAWTLYRPFSGTIISEVPGVEPLIQIAETFAHVQATMASLQTAETADFPHSDLHDVPAQFDALLADVQEKQWTIWHAGDIAQELQIPADLQKRLAMYRSRLVDWAEELAAMDWPQAVDHVDLQSSNAARLVDGSLLIFDWEEARWGCPFFSLDRLLFDAREIDVEQGRVDEQYDGRYSESEQAVRDAYLEALAWRSDEERARGFELAMRLAPIKTAYEGRVFAEVRGWPNGNPREAAMMLTRVLHRWEQTE